jgi:hypothetical protein
MAQSLVLHVSSDVTLLKTRSEILRQHWNVVDAAPIEAIPLLAQQDFDAVVICGSIRGDLRDRLIRGLIATSPSINIIVVAETWEAGDDRVVCVPHFDPESLKSTVKKALFDSGNGGPPAPVDGRADGHSKARVRT